MEAGLAHQFADLVEEKRKTNEVKSALNLQDKTDLTFLLTLLLWKNILEIMKSSSHLLQAKSNSIVVQQHPRDNELIKSPSTSKEQLSCSGTTSLR